MANQQALEWLKAAYSDIRSVKHLLKDEYLTHIVAFHSQQAIEKTLKAFLEHKQQSVPRIHKLETLIGRLEVTIIFDEEVIEILDLLYIESRYPGDIGLLPYGKPTLDDAKKFDNMARDIFKQICQLLDISSEHIESNFK